MTQHVNYSEVFTLIKAGIPVLLSGERGTGKTTLIKHITKDIGIPFYGMSMTRQTTLSHLMGYMNVNGIYVPSQIRRAAESGGLVLLDEIDASDPNVILCLNTIENGYLSFPDTVVELHEDFRLAATSNPQDNHKEYNGRSKLDAATLDRFDEIPIERDDNLEASLVDHNTHAHMQLVRECLRDNNSGTYISMRDAIRYQKRKELNLLDGFVSKLLKKDRIAFESYTERQDKIPKVSTIEECETLKDVWDFTLSSD